MQTLLQLAIHQLGQLLCWGSAPIDVEAIPEPELALEVWRAWQGSLAAANAAAARGRPLPSLPRQQQVLAAFAAAYWRPQVLRIAFPAAIPPGLASLSLVAQQLLHLELAAPALRQLDTVAAACPRLRCLSLRGCTGLGDVSMATLGPHLTALRALDLGGLPALTDAACFHIAKLPSLAALNLSGTAVGDSGLQLLTYGHRVRAWQRAEGVASLPPEAAAWPALPLEHLQLAGTRAGAAGAAELAHLPQLRFLDMRHTGIARHVLAPLQRRFALQFVQAVVLTSSNTVAAAVVNQDAVLCRCGCSSASQPGRDGSAQVQQWEADGVQMLLHWDPAAGSLVGTQPQQRYCGHMGWPTGAASTPGAAAAAADAQRVGMPGGRRIGYREPRQATAAGGGAGGWLPGRGSKRKWGTQ